MPECKPERISFFDTTLRDGEQAPGCAMTAAAKLAIAHGLAELGVDVIEAGFAIASDADFEAIAAIAGAVRGPAIAALARTRRADIERAAAALEAAPRPRLHLFLASSDLHLECKLRISRAEALEQTDTAVRLARAYCDDVEFSPEDATRANPEFLQQMIAVAAAAGATTINLPDTVGYASPAEYGALFRAARKNLPARVTLSAHCHNDLGLAVANTLAAVAAGARQVECTINGIGERAGNAALEEVAAALYVRADRYPFTHGLRLERLFPLSREVAAAVGFDPAPNKAVVGRNAFAHEAGIHQHGVLANPLTYEIMTPEAVGAPAGVGERIVMGRHSGRHALRSRLQTLGHALAEGELDAAYLAFMEVAKRKKVVTDQDMLQLIPRSAATTVAARRAS